MQPIDRPPNRGETAFEAATCMGLAGKAHTSYVAKWDPTSLTAAMNRGAGHQGVIPADGGGGGRVLSATFATGFMPRRVQGQAHA